ncbi:hypothetical protein GCM10023093_19980 [Nemorincola caseinilytica]|uniref:Uncharacterized protein n=1 Tax=Nemorincola caseinilytica TaxID=2054315 RepID=A0ABP8NJ04_9BACT
MKKITLLLASVVMLSGVAFAEGKSCCKKKGEKCAKEAGGHACCKDKKEKEQKEAKEETKKESAKKSS